MTSTDDEAKANNNSERPWRFLGRFDHAKRTFVGRHQAGLLDRALAPAAVMNPQIEITEWPVVLSFMVARNVQPFFHRRRNDYSDAPAFCFIPLTFCYALRIFCDSLRVTLLPTGNFFVSCSYRHDCFHSDMHHEKSSGSHLVASISSSKN